MNEKASDLVATVRETLDEVERREMNRKLLDLHKAILERVNEMDGYSAKADTVETVELVLSKVGALNKGNQEFINQLWDAVNELATV